ncbi:MAG: hemolysin secretion protein D [Proteobacteria bacterium]|nr:MAG: hemolysin secretion protein D [Pseudomonadota bacterium]
MSEDLAQAQKKQVELKTTDTVFKITGLIILAITFGLFGGWAAFAPLDSAALAPGVVMVKDYRKTVQHLEGGIVKDILVRDGDVVKKDDVLVVIDDTQARAQLEILKSQYISFKTLESRLLSERDDLDRVVYPEELTALDDKRLVEAKQGQNQVFMARKNAREGEISVLEHRIDQLQSQIDGIAAVQKSRHALAASYQEEIGELESLVREGYADKQRLRELKRSLARLQGEIGEGKSGIAANEIKVGETRLQILQLNKEFRTEVVNQLGEVQAKLHDINERVSAVEDTVSRAVVKAPDSGMVLGMSVHTVGGVIGAGSAILDIVPQTEELVVEAQVSPIDIDRVQTGTTAEIRFSAFKSATTPIATGTLVSLSADRLLNEQTGMPYYLARVEVSEESIEALGELKLLPGMPAEVLINTGARTLLEYIIQPATNAFHRSMLED